jgi:hypothetical protein
MVIRENIAGLVLEHVTQLYDTLFGVINKVTGAYTVDHLDHIYTYHFMKMCK